MHRKLVLYSAIALILLPAITGCTIANPDAGHEDVLVAKPLIFGHGGVLPTPVTPGLTFAALTTSAIDVNMQPQQGEAKFTDLMTSDGVPLEFDAVIRIQVTDAVRLIRDFGPNWYNLDIEREFSNRVRQAVRKHGMNETAISTTAIDSIDAEVLAGMQQYVTTTHMPVQILQVIVGRANPPDAIKNQRIETAAQEQRVLTEQQTKLAEDARKSAEQSRAEADNAYRNAMSLTPQQFIELERIHMEQKVCSGGQCTFILNGSGGVPLLNVK